GGLGAAPPRAERVRVERRRPWEARGLARFGRNPGGAPPQQRVAARQDGACAELAAEVRAPPQAKQRDSAGGGGPRRAPGDALARGDGRRKAPRLQEGRGARAGE